MTIRLFCLAILLAPYAFAGGVAGTWEGSFQNDPKTFVGFDLDVKSGQISGESYITGWRCCDISDGRVNGDRFSFTVNGVRFEGTVDGDTMTLASPGHPEYAATLPRTQSHVQGPLTIMATANDLKGSWTGHWVGRIGDRPKMIGEIVFEFKADGNTLTGVAHMEGWPGDCPITDAKIENGRISFTATGRIPSSTGIPILRFDGEIHGNQLKLGMRHQIFGSDSGDVLPMDAQRM